jgi:hypothetical protein
MIAGLTLVLIAAPIAAFGDASYERTTQVTGGQLIDSIKNMPFMGKQIRALTDPATETTMVSGNQKVVVGKDSTEITDLDKQVIVRIDNIKKTYSVMTFDDMRKFMADMPARMAQMQQQMKDAQAKAQQQGPATPPNLQFAVTANVTDPGVTREIEGKTAKQQFLIVKTVVTDTNNPGTSISYSLTTEIWTTPEVPAEMKAVEEFDRRFAEKLMQGQDAAAIMAQWKAMANGAGAGMAMLFSGKPGAADALAQMQKEMEKIKGTRILEITRMGGSGTGIAPPPSQGGSAPDSNGGQGTGQTAADNSQGSRFTPGGAIGGALMGAFHKKKANPPPDSSTASATPAATTQGAPGQPADVTLMETTTKTHNFSTGPVPSTAFDIPSGYKQVQSPLLQETTKK